YDLTELEDLRCMLDEKTRFHDLVGKSRGMQLVFQQIREFARVDTTVLIEGETGTGKELVARAIHASSPRNKKPFMAINCAGITDSLLSSQLFGHRKGAFTGAVEDHKGFFEAADGGTLFLDEIGDIPLNVQTNLLRVLQEREVVRLGETKPRKIDVRVLAATQHNLKKEVESGRFRTDFYYRIRVAAISLPPLRDRREDIPLLVTTFLRKSRAVTGKAVENVNDEAMRLLTSHSWPGNVRELQSAVEVAAVRARGSIIRPKDLPAELSTDPPLISSLPEEEIDEKEQILNALKRSKGNKTLAARLLGVSRATFYRRLSQFDLV
ncbi:sigma-54 interaction domain-containing protein, partial [Acidobacteriota bacterium]